VRPYYELDQRLTRMEDLILGTQQLIEESYQVGIDLHRGK
jgi:hypothetical protein